MRRHLTLTAVCLLAAAAVASAAQGEIPSRPEKLVFGPMEWNIPDAESLRLQFGLVCVA